MAETSHTIKIEGLELEVFGEWEEPDEDVGYGGGWGTSKIMLGEVEVSWMFTPFFLNIIDVCVVKDNY